MQDQNTATNHRHPRLLIFDWDGTLMDSESQIVASLQSASADLALPFRTLDECKNIIGLGLREAIAVLYPDTDAAFAERYTERYRHHWFQVSAHSELFPGARETLESLHARGYLLAVATGKGRAGLDRVLEETGMQDMFHATRCADESRSKPHPQMLQELMQALAVEPARSLMVGDSVYDMDMAQQAGVDAVAVTYGVHSRQRLQQHRPLVCLDAIADFTPWLLQHQPPLEGHSSNADLTVAVASE